MQSMPAQSLLSGLKNGNNQSFEFLYTNFFPPVAAYITQHSGNTQDAEDIFQETIIVLLQKLQQADFVLTASLKTYLFAIAKNLWLKRLRDNKLTPVNDIESRIHTTEILLADSQPGKDREEQLSSWLSKITLHCQQVLKAIFFYHEPMNSLMARLGWKNKHAAANQQYKCIQQVKKQKNKQPYL